MHDKLADMGLAHKNFASTFGKFKRSEKVSGAGTRGYNMTQYFDTEAWIHWVAPVAQTEK